MKTKKQKKADLNNYRNTFFLMGLAIIMFISWKVIETKTYASPIDIGILQTNSTKMDETIVIKIEEPVMKKPIEKKANAVDIKIIDDDDKKLETNILSTEFKAKDSIADVTTINTDTIEDVDIQIDFIHIEQAPIYPGCEAKKGKALKKCMSDKISKFVGKEFDTGIASDLGLSGEKVKIMTQFTIDKNGKIVEIKTRSHYKTLAKEAKRVISKLPRMKPGKQRLKPVKVRYTLPIIFNVREE